MATYIVGDIQGCFEGLQKLLKKVDFSPINDHLIAVGDLIGRGTQPLETLDYLYSLEGSFDTVLGNHDLNLLAIYAGIRKVKPNDNLDILLTSPKLKIFINWLRCKPLALLADQNTLVTHAGLYPQWSVKKALKVSHEISEQLQSKDWKEFLVNMYGNEPSTWKKSLQGAARFRFIINAMTRMRFIENHNELDFSCKTSPELAPDNLTPWFNVMNKKLKTNQKVVFGHWASLNGDTKLQQFCGLDTGYVWGQNMTMQKLSSGEICSVEYQDLSEPVDI
ncbi:symmetrical bis(5'-nucleosyl)-tetraphosphatase [Paraglaciecola sp. MB-3u-78]|uniref:symmetrical bis(5'-nucleosyl)-tetraphosphatase n=1 Tax=Paraglaciecola sp. MB-3u-78 TaxID=2058332 RepID=UPI000C3303F5|nr:symmetrical bis(5'-nucleosyl)-tetraphosphatase [Paraglaciecola sp. MB-3u-78]PKG98703.1 symmetrical bis(5'-nucleosyl)-tetraphosphatase [Paraglaciecola sp. MB-3u-78]